MVAADDYRRVEKALRYLGENFRQQPSLQELGEALELSPFHLQRLFTRWAGVSPKRFLQFLTAEHAKERLQASEPVLSAALSSGLSGPSRLHDLLISTDGVTPGEYKDQGHSLEIAFGFHPSPFGLTLIATTSRGICHLSFLDEADRLGRERALLKLADAWRKASLHCRPSTTSPLARVIFGLGREPGPNQGLSLFLKGTNFQMRVWQALLQIPPGTLTSYGRLARSLGRPNSARAVGSAIARNSIAYLIPCHRVIREVGSMGEYRWGSVRKKAILGWEAAQALNSQIRKQNG